MVPKLILRLSMLTPRIERFVWPMASWLVTLVGGFVLADALGAESGLHPASLAVWVFGSVATLWLYLWLAGVSVPEGPEPHLAGFAATHGWTRTLRGSLPARGEPFTLGGDHEMLDCFRGTYRGRTALALYYRVRADTGATPIDFTVVAVFTDADSPVTRAVPRLARGFFRFLRRRKREIALESIEFGRMWRVTGDDARSAHEIFIPTVMARMLEEDARGLSFAWDANAVMTVSNNQVTQTSELQRSLDVLVDVADRMPAYQTLSGAAGSRLTVGDLLHSPRPPVGANGLERLLAFLAVALFVAGALQSDFSKIFSGNAVTIWGMRLMYGALVPLVAYGVIRWKRRRAAHSDWSGQENLRRRKSANPK